MFNKHNISLLRSYNDCTLACNNPCSTILIAIDNINTVCVVR